MFKNILHLTFFTFRLYRLLNYDFDRNSFLMFNMGEVSDFFALNGIGTSPSCTIVGIYTRHFLVIITPHLVDVSLYHEQ